MSEHFDILREVGNELDLVQTQNTTAPAVNKGAAISNGGKLIREEMIKLLQRTFLSGAPGALRLLVFTAVDRGSGCSWVCAHAAEALAALVDGTVCVVEANQQAPSLQSHFGIDAENARREVMGQQRPIPDYARSIRGTNLWFISRKELPTDAAGQTNFEGLKSRFAEARSRFSYVLVDTPPLSESAEALVLGRMADGVVLVVEAHATRREAARRAKECLEAAHVRLLGVVLNKRTYPIPEALYSRI